MPANLKLNEAQQRAILHGEGPARVLAGPGSGKTFVIVHRLRYLLEEQNISPDSVLVITFTKAASMQMQERFQKDMGGVLYPVQFGTFHAVFYHILKQSNLDFSKEIISESDKFKLIEKNISSFQKQFPDISLPSEETWIKEIGRYKNTGEKFEAIAPSIFVEENVFLQIYQAYNQRLVRENKLDFDDMAGMCIQLFQERPGVLAFWQKRFQYIMVDEFQDCNGPQYEVVKLLAGEKRNLFVVGDDDQSIYGFRGASPGIMKKFKEDYPDSEDILLAVNYRSTAAIVQTAGLCIGENKERETKDIKAAGPIGKPVVIKGIQTKKEEGEYLTEQLLQWKSQGRAYEEAAIICRTNLELEEIALLLKEKEIPFWRKEKRRSLFEHFIMRDLESYLRIAGGEKRRSLFLQIINHPVRYIGRGYFPQEEMGFEELKAACMQDSRKLEQVLKLERECKKIKSMSPFLAVNYIRKGIGYDSYLQKLCGKDREKLQELLELADFFQNYAKEYRKHSDWLLAVQNNREEVQSTETKKISGVNLLTMHGSKGLEYDFVLIPDVNEGIIPKGRTLTKEMEEEERRMFYVAMTRAKERLELCYINGAQERKRLPSRFLIPLLERQSALTGDSILQIQ